MTKRWLSVTGRAILALIFLGSFWGRSFQAASADSSPSTYVDIAGGDYNQIDVSLRADAAPSTGASTTLSFAATPLLDAPDLTVTWELPEGGELSGGPAIAPIGAMAAHTTANQTRQVRFPHAGVFSVRVRAAYHPDTATTLNAVGVLFFIVGDLGSVVTDQDPRAERYVPPVTKPTIDKSALAVAAEDWSTQIPDGCFYVVGTLVRGEMQPILAPAPGYVYDSTKTIPVHNILVELRESDTLFDDSYGSYVTDNTGHFEFRFCDDDGLLDSTLELYTRVCAEVWDGAAKIAEIDDVSDEDTYCFDSDVIEAKKGLVDFGTRNFGVSAPTGGVFNIADSLYWAWKYWNNNVIQGYPLMYETAEVKWEPGAGEKISYYNSGGEYIVLSDDPSNPSEWDDSVIIHEWTHFVDDMHSCHRNPGGRHTLPGFNPGSGGQRLSWGEGFPDFYQSAARSIIPGAPYVTSYVDIDGPIVDLETLSGAASDRNEAAVASMLWDLIDSNVDGSDSVGYNYGLILRVFTDPAFSDNAQCDTTQFLAAWRNLGMPTDTATAATVVQNTGIANPFGLMAAGQPIDFATSASASAVGAASALDYRWWDQVTLVLDNSSSMALPSAAPKINTVKSVVQGQISNLAANPHGTEFNIYTFNEGSSANKPVVEGRFYPNLVNPLVNGVAANGTDAGCPTRALDALLGATQGKANGPAWVYTDGDAKSAASVAQIQQQLTTQLIRGSIVLLGGCSQSLAPQDQVTGGEKSYLGLAADGSQSPGIVPYLLTALGTGGQFLFVSPGQLSDASDIIRAQLAGGAGAGKWSDYVSDYFTYRWDRLTASEFQLGPRSAPTRIGTDYLVPVALPSNFNLFGTEYRTVRVDAGGYARLSKCAADDAACVDTEFGDMNILRGPLTWGDNILASPMNTDSPQNYYPPTVATYTAGSDNEWFVISTNGTDGITFHDDRTYSVWLNLHSGEVRYTYETLSGEGAIAEISLEHTPAGQGLGKILVSKDDIQGATSGMGYKFVPAPAQPTRTYTVPIDAFVQQVGFLQTGYSGTFEPLGITDPAGQPVSCADTASVQCITVDNAPGDRMVQFVRVNVGGRRGDWHATIDAGAGGQATFSFSALVTGDLQVISPSKRWLPSIGGFPLELNLGAVAENNRITGWFERPNAQQLGGEFTLYDDGGHGDGRKGDGVFGNIDLTVPNTGVGYLWVKGTIGNADFVRSDPIPFNFQPIRVAPEWAYAPGFMGTPVALSYEVTNLDTQQRCFAMEIGVPVGWAVTSTSNSPFCVPPGVTLTPYAFVNYPLQGSVDGVVDDIYATFTEVDTGTIVGGDKAVAALFRPITAAVFDNPWSTAYLRPNSTDTATVTAMLLDDLGQISGWSGFVDVNITATLGTARAAREFTDGRMPVVFTAGKQSGAAQLKLEFTGGIVATTTLTIHKPSVAQVDLVVSPSDMRGAINTSQLTASVVDARGVPIAGQTVLLSVSDDTGTQGTIAGGEVFTGTTNGQGQVVATFVKGSKAAGHVTVQAETIEQRSPDHVVTHADMETLVFTGLLPGDRSLYLPLIRKPR